MVIEYSKDMYHNYLRIKEHSHGEESSYCIRMLEAEGLSGILKPDCRRMDDQVYYYYDITAKQSLSSLLSALSLTKNSLVQVMTAVLEAVLRSYEYLLDEKGFLISPETIFYNLNKDSYEICYLPGYDKDVRTQMLTFTEYLMNKVDYKDKEAVLLIYQLYAVGKEEGYAFDQMLQCIRNPNLPPPLKGKGKRDGLGNSEQKEGPTLYREKLWESHPDTGLSERDSDKTLSVSGWNKGLSVSIINNGLGESSGSQDLQGIHTGKKKSEISREPVKAIPVMAEREAREEEALCYPLSTYLGTAGLGLAISLLLFLCVKLKLFYNSLGYRIDYSKLFAILLVLFSCSGYLLMKLWDKKKRLAKIVTVREYYDPRQETASTVLNLPRPGKLLALRNRVSEVVKKLMGHEDKRNTADQATAIESGSFLHGKEEETTADREGEHRGHVSREPVWREKESECREVKEEEEEINPTCLLNAAEPEQSCILRPVEEIGYEPIPIKKSPFIIGKLKKNVDYCLENEVVSRYHAKITKEGDRYYLTDLNSTNGTFLNREALMTYQQKELKPGDEISFANIRYRFTLN